jgi:4-amino-4-deoxy-L-arabinose transferase-like glycosyltransferase
VAEGNLPYLDFFFPQMPLLPLSGALFSEWGTVSLLVLRTLSAGAGLLLTWQMYRLVLRVCSERRLALSAAFLVGLSGLFLAWHTTFKPYAVVDLFLLLSFGSCLRLIQKEGSGPRDVFLTFFWLGLAINFRAVFLAVAPLYIYWLWQGKRQEGLGKLALPGLLGLALPSLPAIGLWLLSSDRFWFANLGFHLQRGPSESLSALLLGKAAALITFLLLPQSLILLGLLVATIILRRRVSANLNGLSRRGLTMALLIAVIYLLPQPVLMQYFQQILPYLILAGLPAVAVMLELQRLRVFRKLGAVIYVLGIIPFVIVFISTPRPADERLTWRNVNSVVAEIESRSMPGDTILAEWAGYPVLAGRSQLAGGECFGFQFPLSLSTAEYHHYHLLTNEAAVVALATGRPRLVIIDGRPDSSWLPTLSSRYRLAITTETTRIYENADTVS